MITRREFVVGATVTAGSLAMRADQLQSAQPRRPNLIYVFADQLRYSSCGYAGDEYARTPNIDAMAAKGCNLHQAVACATTRRCCSPRRE